MLEMKQPYVTPLQLLASPSFVKYPIDNPNYRIPELRYPFDTDCKKTTTTNSHNITVGRKFRKQFETSCFTEGGI